ncbi:hypothetical protein [Lysinibacillus yapensis]|nr:hypothetical protein [Lysinibacillus yapensis]
MRFLTLGAIGFAIYGVVRGVRNGAFQQITQKSSSNLNEQKQYSK